MSNSLFKSLVIAFKNGFTFSPNSYPESLEDSSTAPPLRYITQSSSPEEYNDFLSAIKTTFGQSGDEVAVKKLQKINIELLLTLDDWIAMYNSNYFFSPSNVIVFKVDPSTLDKDKNPGAPQKINTFLVSLFRTLKDSSIDSFDSRGIIELIRACASVNAITVLPKKGELSYSEVINKVEQFKKYMEPFIITYENRKKGATSIKKELLLLSSSHTNEVFDTLVNKINPQSSLFTSIEEKRKFIHYDNFKLNLKEILEKSESLELPLLLKLKSIVAVSQQILDNDWESLSIEEKHTFKVSIEKDLPTLIFNYLSLPEALRGSLVDKETGASLKDVLGASFDKIAKDFASLDKSSQREAESIQEIQKTAKYLTARN